VLQGSVVDPAMAAEAVGAGTCDAVEMTRALIADADLVAKVRAGRPERVRPCIRCNQACRVRDNRNPIVSCVLDPASGHEATEGWERPAAGPGGPPVLVVGAGPAGLECARVLAGAGRPVVVAERAGQPGGTLARAGRGPGRDPLRVAADWLHAEARREGAEIRLGHHVGAGDVRRMLAEGGQVVLATGSRPVTDRYPGAAIPVIDALDALEALDAPDIPGTPATAGTPDAAGDRARLPDGPVVVLDPVGDAVGVNLAEGLARAGWQVTLVAPDPVAGTQLARTGDLADANGRLQRAGVERQLRRVVRGIGRGVVEVEDAWTGEPAGLPAAVVVDCGHRLAEESLYLELADPTLRRAGDCVTPRTLLEAVLEGRRAALALLGDHPGVGRPLRP
jgi:2,4-dienoyl-CoA reductase (NADPH2)